MQKKTYLVMGFKDAEGRTVSLKVEDPKMDLTEEQVKTAMNEIIEKNIFKSSSGALKMIKDASIVTTTENTLV